MTTPTPRPPKARPKPLSATTRLERARRSLLYHAARLLNGHPPEGNGSRISDVWFLFPHDEFGTVGIRRDRAEAFTKAARALEVAEYWNRKRRPVPAIRPTARKGAK